MKKIRWQLLIVVISLVAIGLLLAGQQPEVFQQQTAPIQPTSGGTYNEALVGSFGRLNPLLDYYNQVDRDVNRLIFSGLIHFDDRGLPVGDLAESWGISQDGTVYNFSIRQDAVWHDGEPVTSQDVDFTANLLREDAIPVPDDMRQFWKQVEVIQLDEKTVQFRLPEPYAPFLDYLTFGVLPQHLLSGLTPTEIIDSDFNLSPVGSGPYRFDRLLSENGEITGVVLSAFKDYYGEPAFIDQVIFRYYPDSQSALSAYRQEVVQGVSQLTPETFDEAIKHLELNLYTGQLPQLTLLYLNLGEEDLPFFQDSSIRRALMMGLNRQWMIDHLLKSQGLVADGPIFPGSWAYYENIEKLLYDPDNALDILKEAGYTIPAEGSSVREKDGVALEFELVHPSTDQHTAIAEAIQRDWAKLGVGVQLKPVTYEELIADYLEPREYQAALVDLNLTRSPDPDPYPFWDQAQIADGQNYSQWDDRQASEYLERARITSDISERMKAYRNFQVRFTNEMPALPLFYPVYSYAVDAAVQGVSIGTLYDLSDRLSTLPSWFLVARRAVATPTAELTVTP
jgi:peptide/nickel transport system substrate-binding protein